MDRWTEQAFDQMSSCYDVTPSVITFNTLIDACGRAGDTERARQVFSRLVQAGLSPNDRTFSALIHSHAVKGQVCMCACVVCVYVRLAGRVMWYYVFEDRKKST